MAHIEHLYTYVGRGHTQYVGDLKVLGAPKLLVEGNGHDDLGTYLYTVQAPKNMRGDVLKRAIAETFSTHGCNHSYDCCGCAVNHAWSHKLRRLRRGQFQFPVAYGRNY